MVLIKVCFYSLSCRGLIRVSVITGGVGVVWSNSRCYTPHSCTGVFVLESPRTQPCVVSAFNFLVLQKKEDRGV